MQEGKVCNYHKFNGYNLYQVCGPREQEMCPDLTKYYAVYYGSNIYSTKYSNSTFFNFMKANLQSLWIQIYAREY